MSKVNEECCEIVLSALVDEKTGCGKCSKDVRKSEESIQIFKEGGIQKLALVLHQM